MKKSIKITTFIIIILVIIFAYYKKIEINNNFEENNIDNYGMIKVQIIDKYNKMQELYDNPEEEKYIQADIIIDDIYYNDVGIRTKGSSIYEVLRREGLDNYSFKVKLDYRVKNQRYKGMNEIHLNTTYYDNTGIREHTIYEIYNRMGIDTRKLLFCSFVYRRYGQGLNYYSRSN